MLPRVSDLPVQLESALSTAVSDLVATIDRELDQLALMLGREWTPPPTERVTLDSATELLEALERGLARSDVPAVRDEPLAVRTEVSSSTWPEAVTETAAETAAPALDVQKTARDLEVTTPPQFVADEVTPTTSSTEVADAVAVDAVAEEPAVLIALDEPTFEAEPESSGILEALAATVPADATIDEGSVRSATATIVDEGGAVIEEEPEFLMMPVEPDSQVSVDTDDVLVEEEAALQPRVPSHRPSEGNDLGELMFDLEPELNVGVYDVRTTSSRVASSPSTFAAPRGGSESAKPLFKPAMRLSSPDNLELDLSDLLNDAKAPSIRPPPLLRPPTQRSAPPPVPRAGKPRVEAELLELIDEDEIEVVGGPGASAESAESKAPPPLPVPAKAPDRRQ